MVYFFFRPNGAVKIGYVRSEDLIYGYAGTKEVEGIFADKEASRRSKLDTLRTEIMSEFSLGSKAAEGGQAMNEDQQLKLRNRELEYMGFAKAMEEESKNEEAEMMSGVLLQINSFVKQYAEDHGFSMILGTTSSGNILYGEAAMDITDDLLSSLNKNYLGTE